MISIKNHKMKEEETIKLLDGDLSRIDVDNMLGFLENFTEMMKDAWQLGKDFTSSSKLLSITSKRLKNIVILGMGGSAISGDLLVNYLAGEISLPILVIRGYELPKYVNENSLVFAISYSGNTEETISALEKAQDAKAQIIVISSGGKFVKLSKKNGFPFLKIPTGIQPRAALPYLFFPLLLILEKIGLIEKKDHEYGETLNILKELSQYYGGKTPFKENYAKQVALELYQHIPLIYGSEGILEGVARRWKTQINENSKWPCFWSIFSELNHNEIVGYEIDNQINQMVKIVFLEDRQGLLRLEQRRKITQQIIKNKVAGFIQAQTSGKSKLARMFSLIYLGDMVSYYLAIINQINPTTVACIENLKKELARKKL
ncbi:MAG: bifunctional phosphoglucose/phosphomannose isomerase [Candidatus Caldatribacteriota bacterium]